MEFSENQYNTRFIISKFITFVPLEINKSSISEVGKIMKKDYF